MDRSRINLILWTLLPALLLTACSDSWNEHYSEEEVVADGSVVVYKGSVADYVRSHPDYSAQSALLDKADVYEKMEEGHEYTIIVYPNSTFQQSAFVDNTAYAGYCVSDVAFSPEELREGRGIHTWYGKNIWVYNRGGQTFIDEYPIETMVKASNGYVYVIKDGAIPVRQSVYDIFSALDTTNYSMFLSLVKQYERRYFDASKCTPAGTNSMGNTIYSDSVKGWSIKNTLMDRYTEEGIDYWNMRSEDYATTMIVPSNQLIRSAIDTALARIPLYLRRKATDVDRAKFERWIVRACFMNQRLTPSQITGVQDIDCVGGYQKDTLEGTTYTAIDPAMWRPTVQQVRTNDAVYASNGMVYFADYLKIPNNVVIYRLKSRLYELWDNMTVEQREKYFHWNHWTDQMTINCGDFQLTEALPTIYYTLLTAIPDKEARKDSLVCSVTYDGVLYNERYDRKNAIQECYIPAGEYYLRMGFQNRLLYSLSIQFNDSLLVKDMIMGAQGANFHYDRGSLSTLDEDGKSCIGYPEGYDRDAWIAKNGKAVAYDTDGCQVGIVTVPEDGNFKITISSSNMSYLYDYGLERNSGNMKQLKMYHWCLRPTKNNY